MTVPTGHREFWGDGSGGAKAVTAAFVAGTAVTTYGDSELVCNLLGAGTAATFYEIQISLARPGSTTWNAMPVVYGSAAGSEYIEQESLILRVAGSNGNHPMIIKVPPDMQVRLDVRRNGGAADTTALITGYIRNVVGESSIATLSQSAGAAVAQAVNIEEVDGIAVSPVVAGHLPVESDIRQIAGANVAATTVAGTLPSEVDHRKVAGQVIATTGINGTLPIEGTRADDATSDASQPVKIGAVADDVVSSVADDDQVHLITDLQRFLRVVSKAYDSLTVSDKITALNTAANDKDDVGQIDADETNLAAATHYFPSSAGRSFGTRNKRSWDLLIDDVTSCALQITNDGTNWYDITVSLIDRTTGLTGYAASHFTAAAGVPTGYHVEVEQHSTAIKYRWAVIPPNATNDVLIVTSGRAI